VPFPWTTLAAFDLHVVIDHIAGAARMGVTAITGPAAEIADTFSVRNEGSLPADLTVLLASVAASRFAARLRVTSPGPIGQREVGGND
jgi:hypothetical protein